jgi:hypothetical protein
MAVPGRIAAGPGGPAESALLPATKISKQEQRRKVTEQWGAVKTIG